MATYAELRSRIAAEMVREDLLDDSLSVLKDAIKASIRHLGVRRWWFLSATTTVPTVASQNYVTRPVTIDKIDRLSIPALGWDLCREALADIEGWDEPTAQTGQPSAYAENGLQLRLWPVPSAIFTLKIVGTTKPAELSADSDENVWTTEGYDLVTAETKRRLFAYYFRDLNAAAAAQSEVSSAIEAHERMNIDRLSAPVSAAW